MTNLFTALEDKDKRMAALETIIRERLPDLSNVTMIPTNALAPKPLSAANVESNNRASSDHTNSISPASSVVETDPGSQVLAPDLAMYVEERLVALDLCREEAMRNRRPSVINAIGSQLGVQGDEDNDVGELPSAAAWPPYELALQVVEVFVQTNSMWPIFRRVDLMTE